LRTASIAPASGTRARTWVPVLATDLPLDALPEQDQVRHAEVAAKLLQECGELPAMVRLVVEQSTGNM
jgi:hypothetical protein